MTAATPAATGSARGVRSRPSPATAAPSNRAPAHHVPGAGGGTQSSVPVTANCRTPSRSGTDHALIRCGEPGSAATSGGRVVAIQCARWSCHRTAGVPDSFCHAGGAAGDALAGGAGPPVADWLRYVAGELAFWYTPSGATRRYGSPEYPSTSIVRPVRLTSSSCVPAVTARIVRPGSGVVIAVTTHR
ncbi:MAG: hypothetical protein AUG44_04495 [Actinobacteria bacterium 13_1_20CM_3_71_11]|nr:MAG: hypothetical protein AUG44_04495 [Actinobacteria bacterium 13_1_20CM_3_71_11]